MSAGGFSQLLLLSLAGLVGVFVVLLSVKRPWWSTVATLASLALLPTWVGVPLGPFFVSAHLGLALVTIMAVITTRPAPLQVHIVDVVLLGLCVLSGALFVLGLSGLSQAYEVFHWVVAYTFGRVVSEVYGLRRIFTVVATVFTIAAIALVLEWVTEVNLWSSYLPMPNSLYSLWSVLQFRGGVLRAEGAFGHSIAAGLCLAVAAILTLDSRFRLTTRLGLVGVHALAILTTFSRAGMITAAVGLVLGTTMARTTLRRWARVATLGVVAVGGAVFLLVTSEVFAESGSEAENSASYRVWLLELLPTIQLFGLATSYNRSTQGGASFGGFASIDNAILLSALRNGLIPTLILLILLAVLTVRVLGRRAGVAGVAVVSLIPAMASVAFITQYALVFWLTAGIAVTEYVVSATERSELRADVSVHSPSRLG